MDKSQKGGALIMTRWICSKCGREMKFLRLRKIEATDLWFLCWIGMPLVILVIISRLIGKEEEE